MQYSYYSALRSFNFCRQQKPHTHIQLMLALLLSSRIIERHEQGRLCAKASKKNMA